MSHKGSNRFLRSIVCKQTILCQRYRRPNIEIISSTQCFLISCPSTFQQVFIWNKWIKLQCTITPWIEKPSWWNDHSRWWTLWVSYDALHFELHNTILKAPGKLVIFIIVVSSWHGLFDFIVRLQIEPATASIRIHQIYWSGFFLKYIDEFAIMTIENLIFC